MMDLRNPASLFSAPFVHVLTSVSNADDASRYVRKLLGDHAGKRAYVDGRTRCTQRMICEEIVNGIIQGQRWIRCDTLSDLVCILEKADTTDIVDVTVIVLDHAERFRNINAPIISVLNRISEKLPTWKFCVVTISSLSPECLSKSYFSTPLIIPFTSVSKRAGVAAVMADVGKTVGAELHATLQSFAETMWDIAATSATVPRDTSTFVWVIKETWPTYIEPVQTRELRANQTSTLFLRVQPHLSKVFKKAYTLDSRLEAVATSLELPYYTRFILAAAFLASYNPSAADRRYLSINADDPFEGKRKRGSLKRARSREQMALSGKLRQQLLGPKSFTLDRLWALFSALVASCDPGSLETPNALRELECSVDLLSQVPTLVRLGLCSRASSDIRLDAAAARYRCDATYDIVKATGKEIGLDIDKYLHDFY